MRLLLAAERELDEPSSRRRCSSCSGGWAPWSRVPERLIDAAGAVMGVGPAYQALLAEAQVDAAVRHGLAAGLAGRLVAETMAGTRRAAARRATTTRWRFGARSTSPGGTTARGLAALEGAGVRGGVPGCHRRCGRGA